MKLIWLFLILGLKSVISKLSLFALVFLMLFLKDRSLCLAPRRWSAILLNLTKKQMKVYAIFFYTISDILSAIVSYFALCAADFQHALIIAAFFFFAGLISSGFELYNIWKYVILEQCKKAGNSRYGNE